MLITMVVGDWSNDGHGQIDEYLFEISNLDHPVEDLYVLGARALGIPEIHGKFLEEYCDTEIPGEIAYAIHDGIAPMKDRLKNVGFPDDLLDVAFKTLNTGTSSVTMYPAIWVMLYIAILFAGDRDGKISIKKIDPDKTIHIGGYGLYE